jgi:hypothetical protein
MARAVADAEGRPYLKLLDHKYLRYLYLSDPLVRLVFEMGKAQTWPEEKMLAELVIVLAKRHEEDMAHRLRRLEREPMPPLEIKVCPRCAFPSPLSWWTMFRNWWRRP